MKKKGCTKSIIKAVVVLITEWRPEPTITKRLIPDLLPSRWSSTVCTCIAQARLHTHAGRSGSRGLNPADEGVGGSRRCCRARLCDPQPRGRAPHTREVTRRLNQIRSVGRLNNLSCLVLTTAGRTHTVRNPHSYTATGLCRYVVSHTWCNRSYINCSFFKFYDVNG